MSLTALSVLAAASDPGITAESLTNRATSIISLLIGVVLIIISLQALWNQGRRGDTGGALSVTLTTLVALIPAALGTYLTWKVMGKTIVNLIFPGAAS